ncbi:MAG: hypothetical protein KGO47_08700 [Cyanobacteria bacterium REEB417]|nr:hypothetical protein [Cyanobacteria bacterium REEB417]
MSTATTTRRRRAAQSTKVRPEAVPCPDLDRLGSFPPPTAWSEQLAAENLQLARAMASRMARATRMPFDDLFLVAAQGLLKGCRRYNPELLNPATGTPYRLSTFVVPVIRGAMAQWLRDKGHSSGVRFPDRWRDKAPVVRRLAADGGTTASISAAVQLGADEVEAILAAQGATRCLDPDAQGFATYDPDPWDEVEALDELAAVLTVADQAHEALSWADRQMLEQAWERPRRTISGLQFGQFLIRARRVRSGARLNREQQQDLGLEVPTALQASQESPRRRITEPAEILQVAEQLALFGACPDGGEASEQ